MEIHPSITSQAIYGEYGRAVLPLRSFIKEPSKCVNKEHLGVPIVIALVHVKHPAYEYSHIDNYAYDTPEPENNIFETISHDLYDTLLNKVLDKQDTNGSDNSTDEYSSEEDERDTVSRLKPHKKITHKKKHK